MRHFLAMEVLLLLLTRQVSSETSALSASQLATHSSNGYEYKPSSASRLPPGLLNTDVEYPETRETFVHYPNDAKELLSQEVIRIPSPLDLDVTTTVTHWKAPLWDLLKGIAHRNRNGGQIIYIKAHLYVGNGLTEEGCRIEWVDTDTGISTERAVVSDSCQRQCTNGGRYCAPEVPDDLNPSIEPKQLVEETLRRLCIDDLYHATDLKHWEYLEAFETLQCHQKEDMAACSKDALAQVAHTNWESVEDCMQLAGGLEQDVMNVRLQEQLDRQQESYSLSNLPMLHIAGSLFNGPSWDVETIFDTVCQAYNDVFDMTPISCGFCRSCQDVRKCLWYLECDGTPFDTQTYIEGSKLNNNVTTAQPLAQTPINDIAESSKPPETETPPPTWFSTTDVPVPPATTTATATETSASTSDTTTSTPQSTKNYNTSSSVNISGFFVGGIFAGLLFGLLPAIYFAQHEKRTRREISAALAARENAAMDQSYHDDLAWSSGRGSRPAEEEMQHMEDIMLDDSEGGTSTISSAEIPPPSRSPSASRPPKMAFGLHKIV